MKRAALFASILLIVLAPACRRLAVRKEAVELSYLPGDSLFVASMDVVRLRKAPLYGKIDSESGQLKTFLLRLGIDPRKDLDQVTLAFRGSGTEPGEWLALLRGRFDRARIEKGLEDPGARMSVDTYRGKKIHGLVRVPDIGELSFAVIDPTAAALGKSTAIQRALDVRDHAVPSLERNETMKKLVTSLNPKAQVWAVLDGRELARLTSSRRQSLPGVLPEPAVRNLASVVDGRLAAIVSEDLGVTVEIDTMTEKSARNLADAVRGILAFGKLGTQGRDPDSAAALETISVTDRGKIVNLRMDLPGDLFQRLRERFHPPNGAAKPTPGS